LAMMNMRCSAWALLQRNEAAKAAAAATQRMISPNATQSTDGVEAVYLSLD